MFQEGQRKVLEVINKLDLIKKIFFRSFFKTIYAKDNFSKRPTTPNRI